MITCVPPAVDITATDFHGDLWSIRSLPHGQNDTFSLYQNFNQLLRALSAKVHGVVVFYYGVGVKTNHITHQCQMPCWLSLLNTTLRQESQYILHFSIVHFCIAHGHSMKFLRTDRDTVLILSETNFLSIGSGINSFASVVERNVRTTSWIISAQRLFPCHKLPLPFTPLPLRRCDWLSQ